MAIEEICFVVLLFAVAGIIEGHFKRAAEQKRHEEMKRLIRSEFRYWNTGEFLPEDEELTEEIL